MAEEIIRVDGDNQQQLYDYSLKYGAEHDSSYLPGRDFELSEEHPSYLLVKDGQAAGAVSLMRTSRFLSVHKARFSILHSILENRDAYAKLLDAVRPHFLDLESVFLFIPEAKDDTARILGQLGFQVERYSFILEREGPALPAPAFPPCTSLNERTRMGSVNFRIASTRSSRTWPVIPTPRQSSSRASLMTPATLKAASVS